MEKKLPFDLMEMFFALYKHKIDFSYVENFVRKNWIEECAVVTINEKRKIIQEIEFIGVYTDEHKQIVVDIRYWLLALPIQTLRRRPLKRIILKPTQWFKKGVTEENLYTYEGEVCTEDRREAISLLALPCGYATSYDQNPYDYSIELYDFPWKEVKKTYSEEIIKMLESVWPVYVLYAFFHEVGHVYQNSAYYWKGYCEYFRKENPVLPRGYQLQLPLQGVSIDAKEYLDKFSMWIEKYPKSFGSYSASLNNVNKNIWYHENWADLTAAFFMGIVMDPDKFTQDQQSYLPEDLKLYLTEFWYANAKIRK